MGIGSKIAARFRQDPNFSRVGKGAVLLARNIGPGSVQYLANRVPIVQWLPNYSPRWLIYDLIAGQSVALLLIPQALMFAQIAGIPMVDGLLACWLPGMIYTIMGTSKDISIGPSLSVSLVMAQTVAGIHAAAPTLPASLVATVLAFGIGIWSLALGLLNLGFIFDFISLPIALGFVSAQGIILINGQIPAFLGLVDISPVFIAQLPQIIGSISKTKPVSIGLGVASLLLLIILRFVGKKWGGRNEAIRILCISKNILILSIMTLVSFIVNKDLETPIWAVTGPTKVSIPAATIPLMPLFNGLFLPSAAIAFGAALEHVLLARTMGQKNGYKISQSQELVSLGVTNIINSFMGGFPVGGGDLARASVLSESGVKSPLSGVITSATVLGAMFVGSGFLEWIPQPTLGAVIALAVYETMPPMSNMGKFFKISFLDWVGFFASFNFTIVQNASTAVMLAFAITLLSTVSRTMFKRAHAIVHQDIETQYLSESDNGWATANRIVIPPGTQVMAVKAEILFLNATRIKRYIIDTVFTNHSGKPASLVKDFNRPWNFVRQKHIARLRRKAGRTDVDAYSPRIRILILDFSYVPFIDASGMQMLQEIKTELRDYGGEDVDFRFVCMNKSVRTRFRRAGWALEDFRDFNSKLDDVKAPVTVDVQKDGGAVETVAEIKKEDKVVKDLVFEILPTAVLYKDESRWSNASDFAYQEGLLMEMQKDGAI